MSLDQNHFERLESYLDGTLEAGVRAEVDRELAINLPLRKLMGELASVRDWVSGLPRAAAPGDLVETFQGHLERSALLGEAGMPEGELVPRMDRWSHFMSVAAILLLATGLGLVLYKVLPDRRSNVVAMNGRLPVESGDGVVNTHGLSDGKLPLPDAVGVNSEGRFDKLLKEKSAETSGGGGSGGGQPGALGMAAKPFAREASPEAGAMKPATETPLGVAMPGQSAAASADAMAKIASADRDQVSAEDVRRLQQRIAGTTTMASTSTPLAAIRSLGSEGVINDANIGVVNAFADGPIVLLVNAQDPRLANQDVTDFLASNNIVNLPAIGVVTDAAQAQLSLQPFDNGNRYFQLPATTSTKAEANQLWANGVQNYNSLVPVTANGGNADNNYGANTNRGNAQGGNAYSNNESDRSKSNQLAASNAAPIPTQAGGTVVLQSGRYRVLLTNRQQSELNDFIARRGNQWAERSGESRNSIVVNGPTTRGILPEGLRAQTQELKKQDAPHGLGNLADEAHEVMIVVNDQPVILPTSLPSNSSTTRSLQGDGAKPQAGDK